MDMHGTWGILRVRLGLTTTEITKRFVYAHNYAGGDRVLGRIATEDEGSYRFYAGDLAAFGAILRNKLVNWQEE